MHLNRSMLKYLLGLLKNLFNPAVPLFCKIDNVSTVSRKAKLNLSTKVFRSSLDDYSYVGRNSSLVCAKIGKFCSIADGVSIGMGTHRLDFLSTSPLFTESRNGLRQSWTSKNLVEPYKEVLIGNDVWIGERAMILGGVKVGDVAVVGAGAIVTKDVPPCSIVAGVPARVIRDRFSEEMKEAVMKEKWWEKSDDFLKKNILLFQKTVGEHTLKEYEFSIKDEA